VPSDLRIGDTGPDVETWQRVVGDTVSGSYSAGTVRLTRIWEATVGRPVDGMVDADDWATATTSTDEPGAVWLPARWHGARRTVDARLVVLHCTQGHDVQGAARNVGKWWASPASPKTSAHYVVDSTDVVQCVREQDIAWAAGSCANGCGIHVELVGWYPQTDWAQSGALRMAAPLVRHILDRHGLPRTALGVGELLDDRRGLCTHDAVRRAWHQTTHIDPGGPGDARWPWELFLELVEAA
jgi:hypothetical protein